MALIRKKAPKPEPGKPEPKKAEAPPPAEKAEARKPPKVAAASGGPRASLRFLRIAPRKVRLVADNLRGMPVGAALNLLRYTPNAAAKPLAKLVRSAIANAEQKGGRVDVDRLYVAKLTVDGGPKMRRFMPRAMGRAYRIEKRTSHVSLELGTAARG